MRFSFDFFSLFTLASILMAIAKLAGAITVSWWWVAAPILAGWTLSIIAVILLLIIAVAVEVTK